MYAYSSPPMWSFGAGNKGESNKHDTNQYTPGPGAYDEVEQDNVKYAYPQWKQGTSRRQPLYNYSNQAVGPGSYYTEKKPVDKKSKKSFTRAKRGQTENKGTAAVGPGSYHPKKFMRAAPTFSFGYKTDGWKSTEDVPGPGAYEFVNEFDKNATEVRPGTGKSAFLRTATENMTKPLDGGSEAVYVPGPGAHYSDKNDNASFRYFTPTWSFGKANRDGLYSEETKQAPGPGKYQLPPQLKTKGGFTILGKNQVKEASSDTPGPNMYNPNINPLRQTAPAFRIGKSERTNLAMGRPDVPGPGKYFREGALGQKGTKMGTSTRPPLYSQDGERNPGPGAYNMRGEATNNIKYSMGIKTGAKKGVDVLPGPGEYDPFGSVYMEKNSGAIIGTSERPALYKKAGAPGPGQYDIRKELGGTRTRFGKAARSSMAKINDEPGPGFYNIPSAIGNVPKYLLPSYAAEKRKKQVDAEASFGGIFGQREIHA